jgi:hypothetical protein
LCSRSGRPRWAAAHASDYALTWWITAATSADIDTGLAALAAALQPALSGVLPLEALREGAVQWLAAHQRWLLIMDNVTDPADLAPLLARVPAGPVPDYQQAGHRLVRHCRAHPAKRPG